MNNQGIPLNCLGKELFSLTAFRTNLGQCFLKLYKTKLDDKHIGNLQAPNYSWGGSDAQDMNPATVAGLIKLY